MNIYLLAIFITGSISISSKTDKQEKAWRVTDRIIVNKANL